MEPVERTVRIDGRLFRVEALPAAGGEVWFAVVGEGPEPAHWTRLPLAYDSAVEALAAAAGGVMRLATGARPGAASVIARPRLRWRRAGAVGGGPPPPRRQSGHRPTWE